MTQQAKSVFAAAIPVRPFVLRRLTTSPIPSQLSCPGVGVGGMGHPPSSAVASFPLWIRCAFLLSLFTAPSSVSEWSPRCHGIRKEQKELCSQRERVSLPVSKPFSCQAVSSLRRQPQGPLSVEEASGTWGFSQFSMWLPSDSTSHASIRWSSPFFHPPPQGEKSQPTSLDEELQRLSSLRPSLQGFGGH